MINTDNYFKAFKIENIKTITRKELKKRYRILAFKYHPDHNHGVNANKLFRFVNEAYEYLKTEVEVSIKKENLLFYNKDLRFYGNSIYSVSKNRWVKVKGKKVNINA